MIRPVLFGAMLLFGLCIPSRDADCVPSYGDHCDCERKCLTRRQESSIGDICDWDCGEVDWRCVAEARQCHVDRDGDGVPDEDTGLGGGDGRWR